LFSILWSGVEPLHAQESPFTNKARYSVNLYGLGTGVYQLPIASLNTHISQGLGVKEEFSGNVYYVGLDQGGYTRSEIKGDLTIRISSLLAFHYLIPQKIGADSLNFTLRGYSMQFDGFSYNFIPSDRYLFTVGLGFTWGRVRIMREDASGKTDYRNPYFNPMIRSELSTTLGKHIAVGLRAAYRHDWSKTGWKVNAGSGAALPGTRLSGAMIGAFIAVRFEKSRLNISPPPPPAESEGSKN
jgi:hypothetical protein